MQNCKRRLNVLLNVLTRLYRSGNNCIARNCPALYASKHLWRIIRSILEAFELRNFQASRRKQ